MCAASTKGTCIQHTLHHEGLSRWLECLKGICVTFVLGCCNVRGMSRSLACGRCVCCGLAYYATLVLLLPCVVLTHQHCCAHARLVLAVVAAAGCVKGKDLLCDRLHGPNSESVLAAALAFACLLLQASWSILFIGLLCQECCLLFRLLPPRQACP